MNKIIELVKAFGPGRLLAAGVVGATVIAFLAIIATRLMAPAMGLLYSDLALQDSSEIVSKLEAMGVPYELKNNGSIIYVPNDQVLRLRMSMAESGLPSGGSIGWELFDKSDALGTTSFVQNINQLRAMEGELARSIRTIDRIVGARVHLVLPHRELFSRETRKPSASIILKMNGGTTLEQRQVAAIQSLVAAAVPELKPDEVTIVDDRGTLLSRRIDPNDPNDAGNFNKMRSTYEARLKSAVESLVERSVGIGNVRAEVSAEMNFDRETTNAELYDPNSQVARSTQTVEEASQSSEGAAKSDTVTVGNNLPEAQNGQNADSKSLSSNNRTEETVNYEISKTVQTKVHESGSVKRLSVAVLVDGNYTVDAEGKRQYQPRSDEQLKKIEALVKSSIGFDAKRGDQVRVINMKFARLEDDPDFSTAEPELLNKADYIRIGEIGALTLIGLMLILLVLRPLMHRLTAPGAGGGTGVPALVRQGAGGVPQIAGSRGNQDVIRAVETGDGEEAGPGHPALESGGTEHAYSDVNVAQIEGRVRESSTKKLIEMVERHPEEAVSIMRSWMYQDA